MSEFTINLKDDEILFLKMFAKNQHDGAKDNVGTRDAIHVVERRHRCFVYDKHGDVWIDRDNDYTAYNSFDELIQARINLGEKLPLYKSVEYEWVNDILIDSPEEYCRAYNVTAKPGRYIDSYHPVAFFFVLEEARRYKDNYQSHNCNDCRIYTYGLGYANNGDMPVFRRLLLNMGSMLNDCEVPEIESLKKPSLKTGDIAYILERNAGKAVLVCEYMYITNIHDKVIVSSFINCIETLENTLNRNCIENEYDFNEEYGNDVTLFIFPAKDCYKNKEDAENTLKKESADKYE